MKEEKVRSAVENSVKSLANYALETNATISDLKLKLRIDEKELMVVFQELLPLIDYDLFLKLQLQLNLQETNIEINESLKSK